MKPLVIAMLTALILVGIGGCAIVPADTYGPTYAYGPDYYAYPYVYYPYAYPYGSYYGHHHRYWRHEAP